MENWFFFALAALMLMGGQRFLYKVSAEKNCSTAVTTFVFMATVSVVSSTVFFIKGTVVTNWNFLLLISLVNSTAFLLGTISHIEALKRISTAAVYSIIRLNVVITVLFSIFYFNDELTAFQIPGIFIAVIVIAVFTREAKREEENTQKGRTGWVLVFISLLCGAIATISSKFAAMGTDNVAFMAVSYTFSAIFSLLLRKRMHSDAGKKNYKDAIITGLAMGLINFAGYFSFLRALTKGPLSIIVSIVGMHFVIAIFLSSLMYREKLTMTKCIGIALTMISIFMLRG